MNIVKTRVPFTVFQSHVHGTYPGTRTLCITFASHLFLARRENAWAFHFKIFTNLPDSSQIHERDKSFEV
jgi:hypothetical protein